MRSSNKIGKEVASSSLKVSRMIEKKPQFSNLINVLKPKVYITDNSRFMMLVQELTGNSSSSSFSSCPCSSSSNGCSSNPVFSPPLIESEVEKTVTPAIHVMEQDCFSIDDLLSFDSLEQYYQNDQTYSDILDKRPTLAWEGNMSFGEMSQAENSLLEKQLPLMDIEWSVYQDLESWLLETDQQPFQYQNGNNEFGLVFGAQEQEVAAFNLDDMCSWLL